MKPGITPGFVSILLEKWKRKLVCFICMCLRSGSHVLGDFRLSKRLICFHCNTELSQSFLPSSNAELTLLIKYRCGDKISRHCAAMPLALSLSPAAVCQCFTLVSLCTSIADPNWIQVQNRTDSNQLIYGVAFTLHAAQNLSNTAPLGGMDGLGMDLLYTLAALCYSAVLLSSSSFLVDFIGIRFTRPRLVVSLHISTAVMCGAVLAVSGACLYVIKQNVQKGRTSWVWSTTSAPPGGMSTSPGESFYIEILALIFSIMASIFSRICSPESFVPTQFYSVEHEDRERECLITEPGPDEDEWDD